MAQGIPLSETLMVGILLAYYSISLRQLLLLGNFISREIRAKFVELN
jgi:hypothetical protein